MFNIFRLGLRVIFCFTVSVEFKKKIKGLFRNHGQDAPDSAEPFFNKIFKHRKN